MSDKSKDSALSSGAHLIKPTLSQLEKVDQNGIPILENIVEEGVAPSHKSPDVTTMAHDELPSRQVLVENIRTTLKTQLHDELNSIIQPAISTAVNQTVSRLEARIKDELTYSLQQRLNELIEEALKKQFGDDSRLPHKPNL